MVAPNFYNQADQNIYNKGFSFVPQEMYRGGAFNMPTTPVDNTGGVTTLPTAMNMSGGGSGGGGFNPYMPNNNITTGFKPNYGFRQYQDFGKITDDQLTTAQRKDMDMAQNYYYDRPSPMQQKMSNMMNYLPGIGGLKRSAEFIGSALGGIMPVNQRAIMENQLRGSGVFTDDIGRIAVGPGGTYNTPEGIMSGYNASQMTDKTFDKRTDRISGTLGSKYGISQTDIQGLIDGTVTDEDIENKYGITTNLTSNLYNINLAKKNFLGLQTKTKDIVAFEQAKKDKIARDKSLRNIQNRVNRSENNINQNASKNDAPSGASTVNPNSSYGKSKGYSGGNPNPHTDTGWSGSSKKKDGGRVPYMMGGLANLVDIYD